MKVKELIQKLSKVPEDYEVYISKKGCAKNWKCETMWECNYLEGDNIINRHITLSGEIYNKEEED